MLKSSLWDDSDAYILVKGTIIVQNTRAGAAPNNRDRKAILKNCAPFTDCISETNNRLINNPKNLNVAMLMYNLIEYSNNYSKTSEMLWQYCRDELVSQHKSTPLKKYSSEPLFQYINTIQYF